MSILIWKEGEFRIKKLAAFLAVYSFTLSDILRFRFFSHFSFITLQAHSAQVTLKWEPSPSDIEGYRVYQRTGTASWKLAAYNMSTTERVISGLTNGETYTFAATAYNGLGLESAYANTASIMINGVEAFVTRFYHHVLGRKPDPGGLQSWASALRERHSLFFINT